jgi:hypothetical protein
MKLIESKTLGTAAASIEFTSIPQDGTDLVILASCRSSKTGVGMDAIGIRFNGTTTAYSGRRLVGTGSAVYSDAIATNSASVQLILVSLMPTVDTTANTFGSTYVYVPNYAGATNKSVSGDGSAENNATFSEQAIHAGLWSNTAAITSVTLVPYYSDANFTIGSTISLYKVTKGSDGIVTTS